MNETTASNPLRAFNLLWLGQLVSLAGSGLTIFSLGIWVFQQSSSVADFALISLFTVLPALLITPVAGALVDRWDRKRTMIVSDSLAALMTLGAAALLYTEQLAIWHVLTLATLGAVLGTFQRPAFLASVRLLVPTEHLARAGGRLQLARSAPLVFVPLIAGFFVSTIGIAGVLLIDLATYLVSLATLLAVPIPRPAPVGAPAAGAAAPVEAKPRPSLASEVAFGWSYVVDRPGLVGLLMILAVTNLCLAVVNVTVVPMLLGFTDVATLGVISGLGNAGLVVGSLLVGFYRSPRHLVLGVMSFSIVFSLGILLVGLRPSAVLVTCGVFIATLAVPFISTCNQVLWQTKTEPGVHGRVFAFRDLIGGLMAPIGYLVAGPLADQTFAPLLVADGRLAPSLGALFGVGPGRGIGLMIALISLLPLLTALVVYLYPRTRRLEQELPDAVGPALA